MMASLIYRCIVLGGFICDTASTVALTARPSLLSTKLKLSELGQRVLTNFRLFNCAYRSSWSTMAFSYQLNRLTEEELAKDAKEEFGETKNLLEVILMKLSLWTFLFLFSDFHERPEDMDVKISPSSLNSTGWRGPLLEPRHQKFFSTSSFRSSRRSSEDANLAWNEPRCHTKL